MIIGIILITLSFIWLLHETDLLRICLPYGAMPKADETEYKTWSELKPNSYAVKSWHPFWLRHPDNMQPLCGKDWLENSLHAVPKFKIEVIAHGVKHSIAMNEPDSKILKDLPRAIFKQYKWSNKRLCWA